MYIENYKENNENKETTIRENFGFLPSLSFTKATSEMYFQVTSFNFACPLAIPIIGETISSSIGSPANWSAIPAIKFCFLN